MQTGQHFKNRELVHPAGVMLQKFYLSNVNIADANAYTLADNEGWGCNPNADIRLQGGVGIC